MKFTYSALLMAAASMTVSAYPSGPAPSTEVEADTQIFERATKVPFCKGKPMTKRDEGISERATPGNIGYKGNTGAAGMYGCNLMMVDPSIASLYKFTATFSNLRTTSQECICWNKIGPDGGINGFFNGNQALKFTLPAKGKGNKVLAIATDSQGGCACGSPKVPLTPYGQFSNTWLEFDMGSKPNKGWSGADASALVPQAYGMKSTKLRVCGGPNNVCSEIFSDGKGKNAYVKGMEAVDGVGLNIPPGNVRLAVTVG